MFISIIKIYIFFLKFLQFIKSINFKNNSKILLLFFSSLFKFKFSFNSNKGFIQYKNIHKKESNEQELSFLIRNL